MPVAGTYRRQLFFGNLSFGLRLARGRVTTRLTPAGSGPGLQGSRLVLENQASDDQLIPPGPDPAYELIPSGRDTPWQGFVAGFGKSGF